MKDNNTISASIEKEVQDVLDIFPNLYGDGALYSILAHRNPVENKQSIRIHHGLPYPVASQDMLGSHYIAKRTSLYMTLTFYSRRSHFEPQCIVELGDMGDVYYNIKAVQLGTVIDDAVLAKRELTNEEVLNHVKASMMHLLKRFDSNLMSIVNDYEVFFQ